MLGAMLKKFLNACRLAYRRRRLLVGATLSRFVAKDIRRDVEVVDAAEVDKGFVSARTRTWNVLYASKRLAPKPDFGEPQRVSIQNLWDWKGPSWGGPVPDEEAKSKA